MKKISISFRDFWQDFNLFDNIFTFILKKKYELVYEENPDIIFTGNKNKKYNCKTIYFSGEPEIDKGLSDIGLMQYDVHKENYYRFPLYLYYIYDFIKKEEILDFKYFFKERINDKQIANRRFCNFVCSGPYNGNGQYRDIFVQKLMKYKKIDCPGTRYNNMFRLPGDSSNGLLASLYKRAFIKNYKFTIGFENNSTKDGYNGYTTEKFIEPLVSNSLLIYWGNKDIDKEFNTNSFINHHDYNNMDEVIEKIIEIDNDDDLYLEYMNQPYTYNNDYLNEEFLVEMLKKIIEK